MSGVQETYLFSVVIPAHNEEKYIGKCLKAIRDAEKQAAPSRVQIIVVANRCTDRTAEIAAEFGAEVLENNEKCIAAIRNTGAAAATGKILVTVDADTIIAPETLCEIRSRLGSGKYIGGGAMPVFDRASLGIALTTFYIFFQMLPMLIKNRAMLSGAVFWCRKKDFDAVGGFDPSLVSLEDLDFAKRLKQYGAAHGKKYGTLRAKILTSARKFDEFGDWYLLKNRKLTKAIFTGKDRSAADHYYYDVR
ncbi:MAG: glycosyltransferase [Oscillospiraceae bacterium]|nr:glycosyltransferase [Oscillospiraceae bacterium]